MIPGRGRYTNQPTNALISWTTNLSLSLSQNQKFKKSTQGGFEASKGTVRNQSWRTSQDCLPSWKVPSGNGWEDGLEKREESRNEALSQGFEWCQVNNS